MPKVCDNKSVGILVWKDGALLMIERKKYNFGFAIPAGHQDGDDPEITARKELSEEIGLNTDALEKKLTLTLPNPCKREGGTYHEWTIFGAKKWDGEIKPSADETKSYLWASRDQIARMVTALEEFAQLKSITLDTENLLKLVKATNEDPSWQQSPGLEPPMYFLFKELGII